MKTKQLHKKWLLKTISLLAINLIFITATTQPEEQIQKLLAADGVSGDELGYSVSISGDYAIVGTWMENSNSIGAAYIFYNENGIWAQQSKLVPSDGAVDDWFGKAVGISGDYAIVGSVGDDDNGSFSGSAYIFYNNNGTWQEQAKLTPDDAAYQDSFGGSVSIFGDYAIVGSYGDDDNGPESGSAYIFHNDAGTWQQYTKLTASDGTSGDRFGLSVDLSNDYAIIGAWWDDEYGTFSGSAYIFKNNSGVWQQQTKLIPSDAAPNMRFGKSVSISGDHAIVGAYADDEVYAYAGAAYIFHNNAGTWQQQTKLLPTSGNSSVQFGWSVGISGDYAIVGAWLESLPSGNSGAIYLYYNNSGSWQQHLKFSASDGVAADNLGWAVCIDGNFAIAGAKGEDDIANSAGAAYIFGPSMSTSWNGVMNNNWHFLANWTGSHVPGPTDDITIPAGLNNYPTLTSAATCNNITLKSDAGGTATLLDNGYLTVNGTAHVERYFSGNDPDWHLVSSPVSNATAEVFSGMYLQQFDHITYNYSDIVDPGTPLDVAEGYGLYSTLGATNTVTFTGDLNTGSLYTSVHEGMDTHNWNLLGNPFASCYDWDVIGISGGVNTDIHYIDAATGNDLFYVKGIGGTGSRHIPPMQGFFVSAASAGGIAFFDNGKTHVGNDQFYKSEIDNLLILEAAGESYSDETWIIFKEEALAEHDGVYDAIKRISLSNPDLPQIYSVTPSGSKLALNGMPETSAVNIGFVAATSGVFSISLKEISDISFAILEDKQNGTLTDLQQTAYTFQYSPIDLVDRFVLHFSPLAVEETAQSNMQVYTSGNTLYINSPDVIGQAHVKVLDVTGRTMEEFELGSITRFNKALSLPTGYYLVSIQTGVEVLTKKVFIK